MKEIDFKNTYEKRIGTILNNVFQTAWNIDKLKLETIVKNKDYIPKYQYSVCENKYKIDFFFDKFKIIVEYDEERHKYHIQEDKKRMDKIIQFLSSKDCDCVFNNKGVLCDLNDDPIDSDNNDYYILRIKEDDTEGLDKLIGIVLGKIFSLC
ncbi:TPA: hypothetical protein N2D16_002852 [Clostridium botulinum]|nr:hypothetical protein [Clostridium botulinum]HCL4455228.1 hypothetical protein [Clostridium botulinum]